MAEDGEIGINFSAYATDDDPGRARCGAARARTSRSARAAYTDLITEQNEHAVNIWLYFTPYSLVASDRVHGLQQAEEHPVRQLPAEDVVGPGLGDPGLTGQLHRGSTTASGTTRTSIR